MGSKDSHFIGLTILWVSHREPFTYFRGSGGCFSVAVWSRSSTVSGSWCPPTAGPLSPSGVHLFYITATVISEAARRLKAYTLSSHNVTLPRIWDVVKSRWEEVGSREERMIRFPLETFANNTTEELFEVSSGLCTCIETIKMTSTFILIVLCRIQDSNFLKEKKNKY